MLNDKNGGKMLLNYIIFFLLKRYAKQYVE